MSEHQGSSQPGNPGTTANPGPTVPQLTYELAQSYNLYHSFEGPQADEVRAHLFGPRTLAILKAIDANPDAQQALLSWYQNTPENKGMATIGPVDPSRPSISDDEVTRQLRGYVEGLNAAEQNVLGGVFGELGRQLWPNDMARAAGLAKFGATLGDLLLTHADTVGIAHETSEYIPNPTGEPLYAKHEPAPDPKQYEPFYEKDVPPGSFPYNMHETEVAGERGEKQDPGHAEPDPSGAHSGTSGADGGVPAQTDTTSPNTSGSEKGGIVDDVLSFGRKVIDSAQGLFNSLSSTSSQATQQVEPAPIVGRTSLPPEGLTSQTQAHMQEDVPDEQQQQVWQAQQRMAQQQAEQFQQQLAAQRMAQQQTEQQQMAEQLTEQQQQEQRTEQQQQAEQQTEQQQQAQQQMAEQQTEQQQQEQRTEQQQQAEQQQRAEDQQRQEQEQQQQEEEQQRQEQEQQQEVDLRAEEQQQMAQLQEEQHMPEPEIPGMA